MWCSSGAEIRSDCAVAKSVVRSATAIRSSWRGEAHPVQLAVDLGQEVGPREGGSAFGHGLHRHAGRVGQDCVGQIAGVQQGQIVAIGQTGDPGRVSLPT